MDSDSNGGDIGKRGLECGDEDVERVESVGDGNGRGDRVLKEASVAAVELVGERLSTPSIVGKYDVAGRTRFRGRTDLTSCR